MIEVNNLTAFKIKSVFLKKIAKKVLKGKLDLSIVLVGPGRIKELNKKYRKKDKATDVLSFNYGTSGEIVLCPGQIRKNAKKYKSDFKTELTRVLIHGILHILGYEDEKKEEYYLSQLKILWRGPI